MRLLVTRPASDQEQTCKALRAMDIDPLSAPVMEAKPLPFKIPDQSWQALVVTSRNGLRMLDQQQIAALAHVPVYCVGSKTESLAREMGFKAISYVASELATLRPNLVADLSPTDGPILYLTGRHRTGALTDELERQGLTVAMIETYEMVAKEALPKDVAAAITQQSVDGVLFYSQRSCQLFLSLARRQGLGAMLGGLTFYCLSPAIAASIRDAGYPLVVADAPNEDSLLACVEKGRNYLI